MAVSEAKAFRMARDAYLRGESEGWMADERDDYEVRVRNAEDTARILLDELADPATERERDE